MMMEQLKHVPSWVVLALLFVVLMGLYHIRPDAMTEDACKGVLGALLLSLRVTPPPNPTPTP